MLSSTTGDFCGGKKHRVDIKKIKIAEVWKIIPKLQMEVDMIGVILVVLNFSNCLGSWFCDEESLQDILMKKKSFWVTEVFWYN